MKIGGFWIRFTGNNSVMNSGGEPVVVSTVVVGLEVVDVALKSLMISFKVLGFSEMYKDHQELKYQKMPKNSSYIPRTGGIRTGGAGTFGGTASTGLNSSGMAKMGGPMGASGPIGMI